MSFVSFLFGKKKKKKESDNNHYNRPKVVIYSIDVTPIPDEFFKSSAEKKAELIDFFLRECYKDAYICFLLIEMLEFPTKEEKADVKNFRYWEIFRKKLFVEILDSEKRIRVSPVR